MNRNLSKLLQSLAGVVIFSMASLSMAATYTYDFDDESNTEGGGQPLVFGDLRVYGYGPGGPGSEFAYLDNGPYSGMGVCFTPSESHCGSDDNLQVGETLEFVFDSLTRVNEVGINRAHELAVNGDKVSIWTDTGGYALLTVIGGHIDLGFDLNVLKVFGKALKGTTENIYVAGINAVPIPAAIWLFGSALLGLTGLRRRKVAV